ncbi:porin OmpA [Plesiomonas shigelloides]|jgi:OOP family OmpA-OmpF porin|uniref:porin OmpA n=1 Tax=Plesiomonas shigelloides TaxID=703 RepID=UPI00126168D1|nr:porin OmpA [Plesiomonas shigelloides]KAB7654179.1 porin OmpA [Plesiomonas shigelloides]KAB7661379.1 porin OmpA [Plesiomonas shigelloides]KAB7686646.1 porin OmpA [Plesiomonas shigelloides]KAB7699043.1 porin OmpA [Plesiomonas shigelloides]KAB7701874.1 porin OmpA [Plesiomonas shigelloides]
MKKTAIALALAGMAFAASTQAAPQEGTWYTGAKLGWSNYFSTEKNQDFFGSDNVLSRSTHFSKNSLGGGVFGGYQVNPWFAVEMGYDYLNKLKNDNGDLRTQGIQLSGKFSYPVMQDLDLYTRLGAMGYRADMKGNTEASDFNRHETGVRALAAVGAEYAFNDNWAGRLEYQYTNKLGNSNQVGASADNGLLSFGVSYRFGQTVEAAPAPVPAPAPEIETKRFTLTSDVLFNFGKATLKPEGQQALQKMYAEIQNMGLKDKTAVIIGYTDRIGSDAFNMKLSQERAQSVASYLESLGAPANMLTVEGRGKADPVTGNKCDGIKNRNALISCLAPDRRVEIEVQGVKEQVVEAQQ